MLNKLDTDKPPTVKKIKKEEVVVEEKKVEADDEKQTVLSYKDDFLLDYTKAENVVSKLKDIQTQRTRGKFDPKYHVTLLNHIMESAKDLRHKIEITFYLINAVFDHSKNSVTGFISREMWLMAHKQIKNLMAFLDNQQIKDSLTGFLNGTATYTQKQELAI
ncbi:MAG: hypothetical protein ACMG6E_09035 [Candidatus Roizmanbacteria bacterium]